MANRYAPIEDYGIIGDLHTVALVSKDASIDFLCLPSFDSPSVFAALLDADRGGRFQIAPQLDDAVHKQLYLPDTNVLLTRFLSDNGVAEVSDFVPVEQAGGARNLVRRAKTVRDYFSRVSLKRVSWTTLPAASVATRVPTRLSLSIKRIVDTVVTSPGPLPL